MTAHDTYTVSMARYYDLFWTARARQLARGVQALVDRPAPLRILDLCCGTGHTIDLLAAAGHRIIGLDLSQAMLDLARARLQPAIDAGLVTLVADDATTFDLGVEFDVITCAFWSLNELPAPVAQRALERVARHLAPDGVFVAELMTSYAERAWDGQVGNRFERGGVLTRTFARLPDGGVLLFHRGYGMAPDGELLPFVFRAVLHGHDAPVLAAQFRRHGVGHALALKAAPSTVGVRPIALDERCEDYFFVASRAPLDFVSARLSIVNQALKQGAIEESAN